MTSTRIIGFILALIILLPLLIVSVNTLDAEMEIELLESLTEEENDEKDGEDGHYLYLMTVTSEFNDILEESCKSMLERASSEYLHGDLAYKVPTPPPEYTMS